MTQFTGLNFRVSSRNTPLAGVPIAVRARRLAKPVAHPEVPLQLLVYQMLELRISGKFEV
jgi:hypothetical protein